MVDDILYCITNGRLIDDNNLDHDILRGFISAAISYAESYQRLPIDTYAKMPMGKKTKKVVIHLALHFYETRLGLSEGYIRKIPSLNELNDILREDRNWNT